MSNPGIPQGGAVAGFSSLEGGMHSGISPSVIQDNQVSYAVNTTTRGGFRRTRPRFLNFTIDWQNNADARDWFNSHCITGQTYYAPPNGEEFLVCAAGGRFFAFDRIKYNSARATEITPSSERMSQNHPKTWFCQAANYLVAQDNVHTPLIFDGSSSRYAKSIDPTTPEVPTGGPMTYANYRLWVVLPNGLQIAAGDIAYASGTSVLEFTQNSLSAADGGQPLSIPLQNGYIRALIATAQLDTQMGQGVILVATPKAICSINPIIQRSQWPSSQLQNIALIGNGFLNQDCAIVNGDVWGRAVDGWRSFRMARSEFSSWGNTPQSQEIERILNQDSSALLDAASFVYFDNRLLGTVLPQNFFPGTYHKGIVALDFNNISSLTQKATPAYDGLWTGIQPYGLTVGEFDGIERCFAFTKHEDGTNGLWEITKDYGDDNDNTPIPWVIETKSWNFQQDGVYKELLNSELWIDEVRGNVDFNIKYRPDQFPCWFDWREFSVCAKDNNCDEVPADPMACQTPVTFESQYRPRLSLGQPENKIEPILEKSSRFGYEFQVRIQGTGNCELRRFIVFSSTKPKPPISNTW